MNSLNHWGHRGHGVLQFLCPLRSLWFMLLSAWRPEEHALSLQRKYGRLESNWEARRPEPTDRNVQAEA
jgi:hypothetical protein